MRSSRFTVSLAANLYLCRTTWGSLSSSSANILLYCLQHATAKAEHTKKKQQEWVWLLYLDRWWGRTPTKSYIEYKTSKTNKKYRLRVLPRTLSPTRTARTFWLATMLFCSHAVKTTVETGPDLAMSSDSKVSGFDRPHISEKILDSKVSTLESGFKSFWIHR